MKIPLISIFAILTVLPCMACEITLTPGSLGREIVSMQPASGDEVLSLKGTANVSDLTALRNLPSGIMTLDMSDLALKGGPSGKTDWFGQWEFEDGEIPSYMLLGKEVKNVILPFSVCKIGNGAFASSAIEDLKVPALRELGEAVFRDCRNLRSVDMGESSLTFLPDYSFSGCTNLEYIKLPHGITSVGGHAFENSGVVNVSLPGCQKLGEYAFAFTPRLTTVVLGADCKMGEGIFYRADSFQDSPVNMENTPDLYMYSSAGSKTLYVNTPQVGEGAYAHTNAEVIGITPNVKYIGNYAFSDMPELKKVDISGCDDIPETESNAFKGDITSDIILYVAKGSRTVWEAHPVWGQFNISEEQSGVTSIEMSDDEDIAVSLADNMIVIRSGKVISGVWLYSIVGRLLKSAGINTDVVSIPCPDGENPIIVKVEAGNVTKIVKLIK